MDSTKFGNEAHFMTRIFCGYRRLSKVRGSWFMEATDFCHPQARQIHRCIFAPVTSVNAHYYSVLTTPFDMVNAHYVIIDFRAKFFIKIQNQASDTSRSLPSFSSAPFLLRAVPSERLGQVYGYRCSQKWNIEVIWQVICNNCFWTIISNINS